MMGMQEPPQSSLFYVGINIDKRIRANHPLRRIREHIDFDFSYDEVTALRSLSINMRQKAFFHCWSRKEAFIKAKNMRHNFNTTLYGDGNAGEKIIDMLVNE